MNRHLATARRPKHGSSVLKDPVDVIAIGGGIRGPVALQTLNELCERSKGKARLAGAVSDNKRLDLPGSRVRFTWYEQFDDTQDAMIDAAHGLEIPCYFDYVSRSKYPLEPNGFSPFENWLYQSALGREPGDRKNLKLLFVMACYGQLWGKSIIQLANGWFINTHPVASGTVWNIKNPYKGPVPYEMIDLHRIEQRLTNPLFNADCDLVAHFIDDTFDGGTELCRVGPYPVVEYHGRHMYFRKDETLIRSREQGDYVYEMHRRMAEPTSLLIQNFFPAVIEEMYGNYRTHISKAALARVNENIRTMSAV